MEGYGVPIYEYHCDACDHEFEELVRSMDKGLTAKCPSCGKAKANRRLSVFAARQSTKESQVPVGPGCGRCGDPSGPCSL